MARLDSALRARLPDSAFAYVDSQGQRRLPIYDEAHVRNALARFNQVAFEDERARDRALKRLLNAAKKHGIVPVGFISSQLKGVRAGESVPLPSGFVTMLMTDIEGSTALVQRLGDGYRELIGDVRGILRDAAVGGQGQVVETRADEFFAVFAHPRPALDSALAITRQLKARSWLDDLAVRVRVGIHSGYPTLSEANYIGLAVHLAARVCAAAHGGQIVVTADTRTALKGSAMSGVRFKTLGPHRLRGIPDEMVLYQVMAKGLLVGFPPLRTR